VQAVGTPSINFWSEVYRCRIFPIYRHPGLIEIKRWNKRERKWKKEAYLELEVDGNLGTSQTAMTTCDREILGGDGTWEITSIG
jgi:hypothetical protein